VRRSGFIGAFSFTNSLLELKTFNIMAKIELKHLDCVDPKDWIKAEVSDQFISTADCIRINGEEFNEPFEIILDKSTAIRFAKTLRTEINKIEE
tara:strand:+ start:142 stop:423 length:282 start_codon:yes stop_codon:yes gene_type:complete